MIDFILCFHPFENLNYTWKGGKAPIYASYHIPWARKYHSHYKLICEEFLIPMYQLVFLEECKCLSKGDLYSIKEFGDYFFSKEVTYLRMYGGTKAPSLLPRYAIDLLGYLDT